MKKKRPISSAYSPKPASVPRQRLKPKAPLASNFAPPYSEAYPSSPPSTPSEPGSWATSPNAGFSQVPRPYDEAFSSPGPRPKR